MTLKLRILKSTTSNKIFFWICRILVITTLWFRIWKSTTSNKIFSCICRNSVSTHAKKILCLWELICKKKIWNENYRVQTALFSMKRTNMTLKFRIFKSTTSNKIFVSICRNSVITYAKNIFESLRIDLWEKIWKKITVFKQLFFQ